jgi:hypothetical protein
MQESELVQHCGQDRTFTSAAAEAEAAEEEKADT